MNELLRIDEAARYLNVSKMSLRRWTNSGRLRCRRVGVRGERRFARVDLDAFLVDYAVASAQTFGAERDSPIAMLDDAARCGAVRHVCSHFSDGDESWRLFLPYFRYHVERAAPTLYICDSTSRERFAQYVREAGWDPDDLARRALLDVRDASQAYLRTGSFSPVAMLAFVTEAIETVRALGHRTLLVSGEMTWSLGGAPGCEGMPDYEARLNDLLLVYPEVTIVCHYSTERFGARATLDALRAHPFVQLPSGLYAGLYAPPPTVTARKRGST